MPVNRSDSNTDITSQGCLRGIWILLDLFQDDQIARVFNVGTQFNIQLLNYKPDQGSVK